MKICAMGKRFHADRHDLADSRYSQFCERAWNAPHLSVPARQLCDRSDRVARYLVLRLTCVSCRTYVHDICDLSEYAGSLQPQSHA